LVLLDISITVRLSSHSKSYSYELLQVCQAWIKTQTAVTIPVTISRKSTVNRRTGLFPS